MSPNPALLTWPRPVAGGGGGPLSVLFTAADSSASDLTSYTFSGLSLGPAAADRSIIVVAIGRAAGLTTLSSLSVAGSSATWDHREYNTAGGNTTAVGFASVGLPSGTTGNIVLQWSASAVRCAVAVYRVTGSTPTLHQAKSGVPFSFASLDVNAVDGGIALGGVFTNGTVSWGAMTKDAEQVQEAGYMSSSSVGTTSGTLLATVSASPGVSTALGCVAAYAPA